MTPEQVTQKVNEYVALISSMEFDRDSKVSLRQSFSEDSFEYENLTKEIAELETQINHINNIIS